jgi:thioredoxin reductase (NADPH)
MHDVIIIGGGPAGYTAALYSARAGLDTLVLERMTAGGQMATTDSMENYPGFEEPINGSELALKMERQARRFGAVVMFDAVTELTLDSEVKIVRTENNSHQCKSVIPVKGASPKTLVLPKRTCSEAPASHQRCMRRRPVKGPRCSSSAVEYCGRICAVPLRFCPKVYLIHRGEINQQGFQNLQKECSTTRRWNSYGVLSLMRSSDNMA